MPTFLKYLTSRIMLMVITFLVITAILYGILMLAPAGARAMLYLPRGGRSTSYNLIQTLIDKNHLDDPYPVQYVLWLTDLFRGEWGWSPSMRTDVLEAMVVRTPVTAELTLYSVLFFIPLGLASGVLAGWKEGCSSDRGVRLAAFIATSIPPFILGLVLIALFYVGLRWFPIGRLSIQQELVVDSNSFKVFTGLLTIDGFLNRRFDVTLDAFRHLVLPVFTLSLVHWATLTRVTRATMIEELGKQYIVAARSRGLLMGRVLWRHALRNVLPASLNSIALSAASLVTGVFVVEVIFSLPGISEPITSASFSRNFGFTPDIPAAMGFAVYSIFMVLLLMLVMDIILVIVNPRIREEVME